MIGYSNTSQKKYSKKIHVLFHNMREASVLTEFLGELDGLEPRTAPSVCSIFSEKLRPKIFFFKIALRG
jgi:hypothetical protein